MVCETFSRGDTFIHHVDPRLRVLAAAAYAVLVAVSADTRVAAVALALAIWLGAAARLPLRAVAGRLIPVNVFMAFILLTVPLATPGDALFSAGPFEYTRQGLAFAALIAVKGNAIVLAATALVSTMELVTLGHAFERLGVPAALAQLFFFMVRYIDVLRHEQQRVWRAMKVRCFRPGMNLHTYRSTGHLVGMLLVRSFDRSERVLAAMRCRGFRGRFHAFRRLEWSWRDAVFGTVSVLLLAMLLFAEVA